MSIEQPDTVDFVNVDTKSNEVLLAISDHLTWDENEGDHLILLQNKLNTYLRFVESGELVGRFPQARGRAVVISLISQFPPNKKARDFLEMAGIAIHEAGFKLRFELFGPS